MNRFSRIGGILAVSLALAGPVSADESPSLATVLATVNGTEITLGHLLAAQDALPEQFRQMPAEALFEPLIEQLIEQTALMQGAEEALSLREQITLENERRAFIANAALTRVAEQALTDQAIDDAYAAFVADFDAREPTPEYNASHIIVETEEEAQALRKMLDDGADFAELAREHSLDGAAANGGSLGWFGPGVMIPEFEQAVEVMEVGEYKGPLQTQFGWHLVLLNDTRMSQAPALDEVREALEQGIVREAAEAELARITGAAEIARSYDALDPELLRRADLLDD